MFRCGVEEPVQRNDQLIELDEESGRLVLSRTVDRRLNRYSFIWAGDFDEAPPAWGRLLDAILAQVGAPASWVKGWAGASEQNERIRALRFLSWHRNRGWAVASDDRLGVAVKAVDGPFEGLRPPDDSDGPHGFCLLLGPPPPVEELLRFPARPTMGLLVHRRTFAPGRDFLAWLAVSQRSVAYPRSTDLGRDALIWVGTHRIEVASLPAIALESLERGPKAAEVWRLP
jgi:hypothetical protein